MKELYKALVKKLQHEHDFKLISTNDTYSDKYSELPHTITKTFMCSCGKVKQIKV